MKIKDAIIYWDKEKNDEFFENVTIGSHDSYFWKCPTCKYEWKTRIGRLVNETKGCPKCNRNKRHVEYLEKNGNLSQRKDLIKEWNYNKNLKKPEEYTLSSPEKVWWICGKGHEWPAKISNRTKNDRNCPFCSNQKILKGYNDLKTLNPKIAEEWNYDKNEKKPYEIGAGSGKKYWWVCKQGHEWKESPVNRCKGYNCPKCNKERKTSFPEKAALFYIKKYYKDKIISNYRSENIENKEIDIFLPKLNIGLEYDGIYFHKNKTRDLEKDIICASNSISLFHIVETKHQNKSDDKYIYYNIKNTENLEWAINSFLNILLKSKEKDYDIHINRDRNKIYDLMDFYEKEQSLLNCYPELAKEWNYDKNGKLKPEFVSYGSDKKVWWRCIKGHEWPAVISSRIKKSGCPICAGQKVLIGYNDLKSQNPNLAKEWNYERNTFKPNEVTSKSNREVWWICEKGHEWPAKISSRAKGHNCPFCSNQKVLEGYNDLKTLYPEIAKEWNYNKNGKLKPTEVVAKSNKKVWWICEKRHEYDAIIGERTRNNTGCPYCSNTKLLIGYNDLETKNPKIAKEWNYDKNEGKKPTDFFPNSHKKVWWICPHGHEYEAYILDRNRGTGCTICSNKKIVKGINDLKTKNPKLAKYWNYSKNKGFNPENVGIKSSKKVWWICLNCNHEWEAKIADMSKKKHFCSKCKKR